MLPRRVRVGSRAGVLGLALVGAVRIGWAQSLVAPSSIDRTLFRPSARSVGMGGTYLILIDDASGAAFNPAQLGSAGKYSLSLEAGARSENLNVDRINRLVDSLEDLRDQIQGGGPGATDTVRSALNRVYDIAVDAGAQVGGGRAVNVQGEIDPLVAGSYRRVGLLAYGGVGLSTGLGIGTGTGPNEDKRTLTISGGALSLNTIEAAYAFRLKTGQLGLGLKSIRSKYSGFAMVADASNGTITGANVDETDSHRLDLDIGFLSDPIPVKGLPGPGIRAAGVIRHAFAPSFSVPLEVRSSSGQPVNVPEDADYRLNPVLDVGAAAPYKRLMVTTELHNLTSTNGGDLTFHLGGEYRSWKHAVLRAGYDADQFVGGVGFVVGPVRLDLAVASKIEERLYAGLSVRIQ